MKRKGEGGGRQMGNAESGGERRRACAAAVASDADTKRPILNPPKCRVAPAPGVDANGRSRRTDLAVWRLTNSLKWPLSVFIQGQDPSCLQLALSSQQ